ncbi:MAG TPA: RNA polymerase subunit sigma-70 [Streptosporangiaceae bacterium]|jgi:RNA polymerase sigma-70 factor (ECF subfamily)
MSDVALTRARAGDDAAFRELTGPYLSELRVHCYRILGSVQDAEDVLQETLLAAWRGLGQYAERASMRTWLYRIATNRCLNALRADARRPRSLPTPPFEPGEPTRRSEPLWLEPYPDALLDGLPDSAAGPEARYEAKETIALAFITALQRIPPRQRAVLVLRDVLGYRATEVAGMLEASEVSVNSALQRARSAMPDRLPASARLPRSAATQRLAERFATAYANDDVDAVVALLSDDAWFTMPPLMLEYQGREAIGAFLSQSAQWRDGRRLRLVRADANGQPAFGAYLQDGHTPVWHAHGIVVLTVAGDQLCAITRFVDNSILPSFGLPRSL